MMNAVSLNPFSKPQLIDQTATRFTEVTNKIVPEKIKLLPNPKDNQVNVGEMANAIKDANEVNVSKVDNVQKNESAKDSSSKSEKLAKAKANLDAAIKKLDAKIKDLQEKQEKVNSLKDKMKNTKNIFKKAGLAIAYGCAKAGLKIAELAVKAAEGYVLMLQKIVESLQSKQK